MPLSEDELKTMREEFRELSRWNESHGYWNSVETVEYGQHIAACLASNRDDMIESCRASIAADVEFVRRLNAMTAERVRAFEASIRADRERKTCEEKAA